MAILARILPFAGVGSRPGAGRGRSPAGTLRTRPRAGSAIRAVGSRRLALAVPLLLGLLHTTPAPAASPSRAARLAPDCAMGVCALNIDARPATAPCDDNDAIVLAYARSNGATLIQCGRSSDGAHNQAYLFDRRRRDAPGYAVDGLRVFSAAALPDLVARGVPDVFTFKPLCGHGRPAPLSDGQLLLLTRAADAGGATCYRILRAGADAHGVFLRADDGASPQPVPAARTTWATLAGQVTRWLPAEADPAAPGPGPGPDPGRGRGQRDGALPPTRAGAGASAPSTAQVTAAQAFLYDVPEPNLPSHTWLARGDDVVVLDATRAAGWAKVRYIGPAGRPIERWVHVGDLDLAAPAGGKAGAH